MGGFDYQAVSDLLRLASRQGMAKSNLCGQAAQLLERLTICSHAMHGAQTALPNRTAVPWSPDAPPRRPTRSAYLNTQFAAVLSVSANAAAAPKLFRGASSQARIL